VRGVDTSKPPPATRIKPEAASAPVAAASAEPSANPGLALMNRHACSACHGVNTKLVGPGFAQVAEKYTADAAAAARLFEKIKRGSAGAWGPIPMPAQSHVNDEEIRALVSWILAGAK
jgi:cytochrome c551/c552